MNPFDPIVLIIILLLRIYAKKNIVSYLINNIFLGKMQKKNMKIYIMCKIHVDADVNQATSGLHSDTDYVDTKHVANFGSLLTLREYEILISNGYGCSFHLPTWFVFEF